MPSLTDYMDNLPLLFHPQLLSITHALPSRSLLIHPSCKCRHTYALVLYKLVSAPGCCDSTLVLIRYTNKLLLNFLYTRLTCCQDNAVAGEKKSLVLLARYNSLPTDKTTSRENQKERETGRRSELVSVH